MYKTIYVPVDNSDHSNQAIRRAVDLGSAFASKMVGCHVYAAKMHDYRFKQMEYTLPEEYLEETELERQRKIHDSLITMGLKLVSDSYLAGMAAACATAGLEFEPRMMDGKHSTEIVKDLAAADYDLVVIGVLGLGRVRDSQVGSVCERVARKARQDVLVVKELPDGNGGRAHDTILVGIDTGSWIATASENSLPAAAGAPGVASSSPQTSASDFAGGAGFLAGAACSSSPQTLPPSSVAGFAAGFSPSSSAAGTAISGPFLPLVSARMSCQVSSKARSVSL